MTRPLSNDSMLGVAKIATIIMMSAASIKKMVCPHFRRLTCSGAVWLLSDNSVTSVIHHLGIAQRVVLEEKLAGSSTMARSSTQTKCFLGNAM